MAIFFSWRRSMLLSCFALFSGMQVSVYASEADTSNTLQCLITNIDQHPAFSEQMCSFMVLHNDRVAFFGFPRGVAQIDRNQFLALRQHRDGVVSLLRGEIGAFKNLPLILTPQQKQGSKQEASLIYESPWLQEYGFQKKEDGPNEVTFTSIDPSEINYGSHLQMLMDLNGSEALEELIAEAERLTPAGPLEKVHSDVYSITLSTILTLLYYERDLAVLNSEFMPPWRESLKGFGSISGEQYQGLDPSRKQYYLFDPWEQRALSYRNYPDLPLTPERQQTILRWAREFVARVPVEQRARAKNMSPDPTLR